MHRNRKGTRAGDGRKNEGLEWVERKLVGKIDIEMCTYLIKVEDVLRTRDGTEWRKE